MKKAIEILSLVIGIVASAIAIYSWMMPSSQQSDQLKKIDYIPSNFFDVITPASSVEKIIEMFGMATKTHVSEENGNTSYFYDLKNAYLIIDFKGKEKISVISIQSKNIEPYIKIGGLCPLDIKDNYVFLGKSYFNQSPKEYNEGVEISRDRCDYFAFKYTYTGRPCYYYNFMYGTFIENSPDEFKNINEQGVMFDASYGTTNLDINKKHKIDYMIIGDDDIIKKNILMEKEFIVI